MSIKASIRATSLRCIAEDWGARGRQIFRCRSSRTPLSCCLLRSPFSVAGSTDQRMAQRVAQPSCHCPCHRFFTSDLPGSRLSGSGRCILFRSNVWQAPDGHSRHQHCWRAPEYFQIRAQDRNQVHTLGIGPFCRMANPFWG